MVGASTRSPIDSALRHDRVETGPRLAPVTGNRAPGRLEPVGAVPRDALKHPGALDPHPVVFTGVEGISGAQTAVSGPSWH